MRKPKLKRIYDEAEADDGFRVLMDRVWPRGLSKQEAGIDLWLKEIAPSTALRKWFGHAPERWPEFRRRYFEELDAMPETVARLCQLLRQGKVTLLYGAKDEAHNNAVALSQYLQKMAKKNRADAGR